MYWKNGCLFPLSTGYGISSNALNSHWSKMNLKKSNVLKKWFHVTAILIPNGTLRCLKITLRDSLEATLPNIATMVLARSGGLRAAIDGKHAPPNTKLHAVYAHFFLGFTIEKINTIYRKGKGSMSRWVSRYRESGDSTRCFTDRSRRKFFQHSNACVYISIYWSTRYRFWMKLGMPLFWMAGQHQHSKCMDYNVRVQAHLKGAHWVGFHWSFSWWLVVYRTPSDPDQSKEYISFLLRAEGERLDKLEHNLPWWGFVR